MSRDDPPGTGARAVVVVEGVSDRAAVEALAGRRGRDLAAEGVRVLPVGGAQAIARALACLRSTASAIVVAGLCDAGEERHLRRAVERAGLGAADTRAALAARGFHVCDPDLEGELIRALGEAAVQRLLAAHGDLGRFRTLQRQPEWRGRPADEQLRRFLGSGGSRKIVYARRLVDALDLRRAPAPLDGVLAHVAIP
jgi:hypothetical protein